MRPPGKKIGKIHVDLPSAERVGPLKTITLDLRCTAHNGKFHAVYRDETFTADSVQELRAQLEKRAKLVAELVWERYVVVSYEARVTDRQQDSDSNYTSICSGARPGTVTSGSWEPGDPIEDYYDQGDRVVCGFELCWYSAEWTQPIDDGSKVERMRRMVHCDNSVSDEVTRDELPAGALPWSPGLVEALELLREGIRRADRAIWAAVSDDCVRAPDALPSGEPAIRQVALGLLEAGARMSIGPLPSPPPEVLEPPARKRRGRRW